MDIYKFPLQELMLRFPTICFPAAYSLVALLAAVTSPPDFRCENNDFVCENGIQCIPEEKVCDGQEDCTDGSDEADHNCCKKLIAIYRRYTNGVHFSEIWENTALVQHLVYWTCTVFPDIALILNNVCIFSHDQVTLAIEY